MPINIQGTPFGKRVAQEPHGRVLETLPMSDPSPATATTTRNGTSSPRPAADTDPRPYGNNTDPETGSYRVGKCRTPEHSRIRAGEVRNPRGRPKGSRNRATMLRDAVEAKVVVPGRNGRSLRQSMREVAYRQLVTKAAKGDLKAIELLDRLEDKLLGSGERSDVIETPLSDSEIAILERHARG